MTRKRPRTSSTDVAPRRGNPKTEADPRPALAPHPFPDVTWSERRRVSLILALYAGVLAVVLFAVHRTPLWGVETDLLGEYLPAAEELLRRSLTAAHYGTKGFGYPLLLAVATAVCGGDGWAGARLLNLVAAVAGLYAVWALARSAGGPRVALATLFAVMLNPVHFATAVEAGTDQPAFALAVGSTALLLGGGGRRRYALAGLLAGWSFITRYNAAFLLPAAAISFAFFPGRASLPSDIRKSRGFIAYAALAALPIGAWMATNAALTGSPFTNTNHLNVAYALYGRLVQTNPDVIASLHSFASVLAFDPARAFATFARQIATNWTRDLTQLVPAWIGAFSVLGLALGMPGLRNRGMLATHLVLSYLSVSLVFYDARFALYALPFYVMTAMALLLEYRAPWLANVASAPRVRTAVAAIAVLASGVLAIRTESALLARAPHQIHDAAARIRASGIRGNVIARKPHVPWFAGTGYVPFPARGSLSQLLALGRAENAAFLYISAMEIQSRPDLEFLAEPDVRMPGLEPFAAARLDSARFYTLYRLTGEVPTEAAVDSALVNVLAARVARRPSYTVARNLLAGHLLRLNRFAEARAQAEATVKLAPNDAAAWGILCAAAWRMGDLTRGAEAGDRALALTHSWWIELHMGKIRTEQRRFDDAFAHFQRALAANPASLDVLLALGQARLLSGDAEGARDELKRALMLAPNDATLRAQCAGLLRQAGREDLAREIETVR